MKLTRRDLMQGVATAALAAGIPYGPSKLEAQRSRSQGGLVAPTGRNQAGVNGIAAYSNIHPFSNWWKNGSDQVLTVTCAKKASITRVNSTPSVQVVFTDGSPTIISWSQTNLTSGKKIRFSNVGGSLPIDLATGLPLDPTHDYFISPNAAFTGYISNEVGGAGTVLTVTGMTSGIITVGPELSTSPNAIISSPPTIITAQLSGTPAGVGRYSVNNPQLVTGRTITQIGNSINALHFSARLNGPAVNTSGPQSGRHFATGERWHAVVTTTAPHGLYQPDTTTNLNATPPNNRFWQVIVQNATNAAYNHSISISAPFNVTMTGASTFTYPLASDTDPGVTATGDYVYTLRDSVLQGFQSLWGLNGNITQFMTADGEIQPNIPNATSCTLVRQVHGLDLGNGAIIPPGYSRGNPGNAANPVRGQLFRQAVTFLGDASPTTSTFGWSAVNDAANLNVSITFDPAKPPRDIYYGLDIFYSDWLLAMATDGASGSFFDTSYYDLIRPACGTVRFLDWMGGNAGPYLNDYSKTPSLKFPNWGGSQVTAPNVPNGMPIAVLCQLINKTTKHPWFSFSPSYGCRGAIVAAVSKSNPMVITFQTSHTYKTGDTLFCWSTNGGTSNNDVGISAGLGAVGFGQASFATWSTTTNRLTKTGHGLSTGQPLSFTSGAPSNLTIGNGSGGTVYFACNVTANDFQIATSVALANAGKNVSLTRGSGTAIFVCQLIQTPFIVGNVTATTVEVNCNSTNWGTPPVQATSGVAGQTSSPIDFAAMTPQLTSLFQDIRSRIPNSLIIPRFEVGNEPWNNIFPIFSWLGGMSRMIVDAAGNPILSGSQSQVHGYIFAHVAKVARDVWGTGRHGIRPWESKLNTQGAVASSTQQGIIGINTYLSSTGSPLDIRDLLDDVVINAGYYGGQNALSNAQFGGPNTGNNRSPIAISATSPSRISFTGGYAQWLAIAFTTTGTLPTDLATGLPLETGDMASCPQISFTGSYNNDILTAGAPSGGSFEAGMTVFGLMSGSATAGIFQSGVKDAVIQGPLPFPGTTGTGGAGTYKTIGPSTPQTVTPARAMMGLNINKNSKVYYNLDQGAAVTSFRFASKIASRFRGTISNGAGGVGARLTINPGSINKGPVEVGQVIMGMKTCQFTSNLVSGTTIVAQIDALTWVVDTPQFIDNEYMRTGVPINIDPAYPGSGVHSLYYAPSTQFVEWARDSVALGPAPLGNGTYASKYQYFDYELNWDVQYGDSTGFYIQNMVLDPTKIQAHIQVLVTSPGGGASLIPDVGIGWYEGGWGNEFGFSVAPNNITKFECVVFQEFGPQACHTVMDGDNWRLIVETLASVPAITKARMGYTGTLRSGQPSAFVLDGNVTARFAFSTQMFVDPYVGMGGPNWQNSTNQNGRYAAFIETN